MRIKKTLLAILTLAMTVVCSANMANAVGSKKGNGGVFLGASYGTHEIITLGYESKKFNDFSVNAMAGIAHTGSFANYNFVALTEADLNYNLLKVVTLSVGGGFGGFGLSAVPQLSGHLISNSTYYSLGIAANLSDKWALGFVARRGTLISSNVLELRYQF